jgi:hypothetical protein
MNNLHSVAAMLGLCMFKKAVRTLTVTLETVPNKLHIKYKECRKKTRYNGLEPTELVSYYITRPLHLRSHPPPTTQWIYLRAEATKFSRVHK